MKPHLHSCLSLGLGLVFCGIASSERSLASTKESAPKRAKVLNIPAVPDVPLPQSVFNIPSQPSEGRNPFFPQSTVRVPVPNKVSPQNPVDTTLFVLNGITSPPKRTAMINGRTFEPGEEGEVRLPGGGKMLIKCEEIKSESATISVGGQRRELRLRSGL
jgi:hypothetical protein